MPASPYPLPIDLELMPAPACLGLGTAHYIFPSCTEENMQVRTARPAVMTDESDPLGVAMDEHRGAFYLASVWQRPVTAIGDEQRLTVPLFAGTRDVAYAVESAAFMRLSESLAAPDSPWNHARRADLYAVPGTFVLWGVERLTAEGVPSASSGHLAGIFVRDDGPVVVTPETMHTLLVHLSPSAMSKGSQALFYNTVQALSERPVRADRGAETLEVTEALAIFRSLHPRPVSRVQAAPAGVTAGEEAAVGMPSYLALVSG